MADLSFDDAKSFGIKFGKHKGRTLNQVAADGDEGLQYIMWMSGLDDLREDTRSALDVFLANPAVALDVENAMRNRNRQ